MPDFRKIKQYELHTECPPKFSQPLLKRNYQLAIINIEAPRRRIHTGLGKNPFNSKR